MPSLISMKKELAACLGANDNASYHTGKRVQLDAMGGFLFQISCL